MSFPTVVPLVLRESLLCSPPRSEKALRRLSAQKMWLKPLCKLTDLLVLIQMTGPASPGILCSPSLVTLDVRLTLMIFIGKSYGMDKGRCSFTQHIVNVWNSFPQDVVMATSLDSFEKGLDTFMEERSNSGS